MRRGDKDAVLAAVQEGFDYYNRRDLTALFDFFGPQIERIPPAHSLEQPQRGHAAVREMFDRWLEGWDELRVEVEDVVVAGTRSSSSCARRPEGCRAESKSKTESRSCGGSARER